MKKRVQTFKIVNWLGMPIELSPITLAISGFECVGISTVRCQFCGAEQDMSFLQFNSDKEAIERGVNQLKQCHMPECVVDAPKLSQWKDEGIWDRRQVYLYAQLIFNHLLECLS